MHAINTLTFIGSRPGSICVQCVHAVGDKPNGTALDVLEMALEHADVPTIIPRVERAQTTDPKDVARLGKGGDTLGCSMRGKTTVDHPSVVIASTKPTHASCVRRFILLSRSVKIVTCL